MNTETRNHRIILILLILVAISATLYTISLKIAYPVFQNTRLLEPLAQLHSLFPLYYISLFIMAVSGAACFIFRIQNRTVHIIILLALGIVLWYTRYYLAAFTWEPDSARNLGISLKIPEILNGYKFPYSNYGETYPLSFILEYVMFNASGTTYNVYLHLMPFVNIVVFTLLCYAFSIRLFNSLTAFIITFAAMIGMHYMNFIMGPHTMGVLLLLTILVMMWARGLTWRILTFILIPVLVVSHPISPILLGIFLGTALVTRLSFKRNNYQLILAAMLVICMLGWYFWPQISPFLQTSVVQTSSTDINIGTTLQGTLEDVASGNVSNAVKLIFGDAFVYGSLFNLNKAIYAFYAALAAVVVGLTLVKARRRNNRGNHFKRHWGGLSRKPVFLAVSFLTLVVLSLLLAQKTHDMVERALTPAILVLAALIFSQVSNYYFRAAAPARGLIAGGTTVVLVLLTLLFPLVAMSIDSYSSYPASEESGLRFVADHIPLEEKTLVCSFGQQMVLFQTNVKDIKSSLKRHTIKEGEVFVIRRTGYYYATMRYDLSFENNRITRLTDTLNESTAVNSIYFNPTTSVFVKR